VWGGIVEFSSNQRYAATSTTEANQETEMTTATETRAPLGPPAEATHSDLDLWPTIAPSARPVVVAVDDSPAAEAAVRDGVRVADELEAPVVFVYVRRGPSAALGEPYYQRRLDAEMRIGDRAIAAGIAAARRAGVPASAEQLHGAPARRLKEFARLRDARFIVVGARRRWFGRSISRAVIRRADRPVMVARRVQPRPDSRSTEVTRGSRGRAETPFLMLLLAKGKLMPYGMFPDPKRRPSGKGGATGPSLAVRIRTRLGRAELDSELANGTDPASSGQLALRAEQLSLPAERARIANSFIEALDDARRGEPMTRRLRPQREVVRGAADDILALVLRLRDDRPVGIAGVAAAARLVDDWTGPMHRDDAGDLHDAIRLALSALEATAEPAEDLQAQAA
jgi:nucleotide-binding universal stress UspA family protein